MNPCDDVRPEIRTLHPYTIEETSARIKLDANESPFRPTERFMQDVSKEVQRLHLNRYPDPGARRLKDQISSLLKIESEQFLLGNGSDELISYLITTFTGQEKGVLFPTPTFSMYGIIAKTLGQNTIEVPLNEDFQIPSDLLLKTIEERSPQIIFLASPNNPTGNSFAEETILQVVAQSNALVVVDEAYSDFSDHPGFMDHLQKHPNLVILRTLSKIGMAALRIGMLIGSPEVVAELEKVRLPYNINALSQAVATVLLGRPEVLQKQIREIVVERKRLFAGLSDISSLQLFPSQANFILFRTESADKLYQHLMDQGILLRNLDQPGALSGCLRVTVGNPHENNEFLEQMRQFYPS